MTDESRSLPGVVIGTAGHVDHGKTSLVRALTGIETDRWREERERGLTIDIGFARLDLDPGLETGIVDVPGHEDFLKNMLAGATGIDLLLLVVAADEGPMPQTREHLAIARLLDVERGVVALTKVDRVDAEWQSLAEETVRELLAERPETADWPILPVSSASGQGLDALRAALRDQAQGAVRRRSEDLFRMPVDRAFSIRGTGTVVTGTVWSGTVAVGDTLELLPRGERVRVRGLEVHERPRRRVEAGRRCAVALVGVGPREAQRGSVLVGGGPWRPVRRLGARLEVLASHRRPIEDGQRLRVYLGTREVMARVHSGGEPILPGEAGWAVLALESPLVARVGDRAILRFYSPVTTLGGLRVCELDPPRRWRKRTSSWGAVLEGSPQEAFEAAVRLRGAVGMSEEEAPLALGRPRGEIGDLAAESASFRYGGRWFSPEARDEALEAALEAVRALHASDRRAGTASLETVRSTLAATRASELVAAVLADHIDAGRLVAEGPRIALPGSRPDLTPQEQQALDRLRAAIAEGGLQPPTVKDLAQGLDLSRDLLDDLLRLLAASGDIRPITPEIYVSSLELDRLSEATRRLLAGSPPAAPTVFKDAFGLSRKYLIPLLEYLDGTGITRRTAEGRVLA